LKYPALNWLSTNKYPVNGSDEDQQNFNELHRLKMRTLYLFMDQFKYNLNTSALAAEFIHNNFPKLPKNSYFIIFKFLLPFYFLLFK